MEIIYKYQLDTTDIQNIKMPKGAEILCIQVQNNIPCIWCLVNPDNAIDCRTFEIYGTGNPIPTQSERKYSLTTKITTMKLKTIFSCLLLAMFSMATIAAVSFTDRQEKSEIKKSETIQNPNDLSMIYHLSEKLEQNVSCKKVERISCAGCHSTYHDIGSLSSPRNL